MRQPDRDEAPFLSSQAATPGQRRAAVAALGVCAVAFALLAPFARAPLTPLPSFIPAYQAALALGDTLAAVVLFGQFVALGRHALLWLAGGYLFTACMALLHGLTFPGLVAPGGLLGAGPQTTAWLYMLWHAGFPLAILAYARSPAAPPMAAPRRAAAGLATVLAAGVAALACTALATRGHDLLPPIMAGHHYTPAMPWVVGTVWLISAAAGLAVWRRRRQSLLDLWLGVVACAWLFDIALSAVLNGGRFDLGFYAGRLFGLLSAVFVLAVLLVEHVVLHARMATAFTAERRRAAELQRLNAALDDVNTRLRQASRFRSEFLSHMAHELRTPLNAIIGFSELLRDGHAGPLDDKQRRFAAHIHGGGEHLLSLVNDVLDLSKVEAGRMALDLDTVDAGELLGNCLSLLDEAGRRDAVSLRLELPEALPPLAADARKLRQIVFNLVSNAQKYAPPGSVVAVSARRVAGPPSLEALQPGMASRVLPLPRETAVDAVLLELRVDDAGPGMAPEELPHLFEPFAQAPSSARIGRQSGTGLGLALVARLAALHGGSAGVASGRGCGTRFAVWLPWREPVVPAVPAAAALVRAAAPAPVAMAQRRSALVIEDDDAAAELVQQHLQSAGFTVRRAKAAHVLGEALCPVPDIVILDLLLPGNSGWDVLERLKADPLMACVPVVIVSVVADPQRGLALGAAAVLQKPVPRQVLLDVVAAARPLDRADFIAEVDRALRTA